MLCCIPRGSPVIMPLQRVKSLHAPSIQRKNLSHITECCTCMCYKRRLSATLCCKLLPANMRHWPNVGLMLGQRLRWWHWNFCLEIPLPNYLPKLVLSWQQVDRLRWIIHSHTNNAHTSHVLYTCSQHAYCIYSSPSHQRTLPTTQTILMHVYFFAQKRLPLKNLSVMHEPL